MDRDQNSASYVSSFQADDLMEKLKLLNYERLLLKEMKMKQINRYYFLKSFNPGEQFFMFTSICAWLIRKIGKTFDQPQEFDDPNMVISRIIRVLQEMVSRRILFQSFSRSFMKRTFRRTFPQTFKRTNSFKEPDRFASTSWTAWRRRP